MDIGYNMALTWLLWDGDSMNKFKNSFIVLIFVFLCFITIVIDWAKWDIIQTTTPLLLIVICILQLLIFLLLLVLAIAFIIKKRGVGILSIIILTATISLNIFWPFTDIYLWSDYLIKEKWREDVILMVENGSISYFQTGVDRYTLKFPYRLTSHTGQILIDETEKGVKLLFYVHAGILKSSAIIYVSDQDDIKNGDFGLVYKRIIPLKRNWFAVIT